MILDAVLRAMIKPLAPILLCLATRVTLVTGTADVAL